MKKRRKHVLLGCGILVLVFTLMLVRCDHKDTVPNGTNTYTTEILTGPEVVETQAITCKETVSQTEPPELLPTDAEAQPTETQTIHEHRHSITVEKNAGCFTDGYLIYECLCGNCYKETVAARGYHRWTDWKIVRQATSNKSGLEQRSCKDCGSIDEKLIDKLPPAESTVSESIAAATEPNIIEPAETHPAATELSTAAPTACQHTWQSVYHAEEGHYGESYVVCVCGYKCQSQSEWIAHVQGYSGEEALLNHTSWGSAAEYIVDSPEYYEWVCSNCGESTTTKP